jgi:hypothetical protein
MVKKSLKAYPSWNCILLNIEPHITNLTKFTHMAYCLKEESSTIMV